MSFFLAVILLFATTSYAVADDDDDAMMLKLLGHTDAGNTGQNTDIWALGDFAYTGTWGGGIAAPNCPSLSGDPRVGVKIIDIRDPENPTVASVIDIPPGTRANDIKVISVETESFEGDLLAHSLEACDGSLKGTVPLGFRLYDVTDGYNPVFLGYFDTGLSDPHNVYLFQQAAAEDDDDDDEGAGGRVLVMTADDPAVGVRFVDVTDPTAPVQIGAYNIFVDNPELVMGTVSMHDVWANDAGDKALFSYWDAGVILADISDPTAPVALGRFSAWPAEEGNHHSAVFAHDDQIVIINDEIFACPWGFMRIVDFSDPAHPVQIATFAIPEVFSCPDGPGFWSVHNPWVVGDLLYDSWYGGGFLVFDISDPADPVVIDQFQHAGGVVGDLPHPGISQGVTSVWGVVTLGDLIIASDIDAGVFILELTELDDDEDEDD